MDHNTRRDKAGSVVFLIQYLVAQYGLAGAIEVYLSTLRLQVEGNYDQKAKKWRSHFSSNPATRSTTAGTAPWAMPRKCCASSSRPHPRPSGSSAPT